MGLAPDQGFPDELARLHEEKRIQKMLCYVHYKHCPQEHPHIYFQVAVIDAISDGLPFLAC